jgi:hypothetical protein
MLIGFGVGMIGFATGGVLAEVPTGIEVIVASIVVITVAALFA